MTEAGKRLIAAAKEARGFSQVQAEEYAEKLAWSGDYDGTECPNCHRLRMLKCSNGKRRCEKCNWDPDDGQYSDYPGA